MPVQVSAPARLHLGDLDPFGWGRFGYAPILALEEPRTEIEAWEARELQVEGPDAKEARVYAERVLEAFHLPGAGLKVKAVPPRHCGFGSTTSLSLAVGTAITRAHGLEVPLLDLVQALKRTSTGGIYPFQRGGFVVAGGLSVPPGEPVLMRDNPLIPPLVFHAPFPPGWCFVLVHPTAAPHSPDQEVEEEAFGNLRDHKAPAELIHKGYFTLAARMVPALLEGDATAFGRALTSIQVTVGRIYQPVQEQTFNPASQWLIPVLNRSGALGIGQSSWGPLVYAFSDSHQGARDMAARVQEETRGQARVQVAEPDNQGARITSW